MMGSDFGNYKGEYKGSTSEEFRKGGGDAKGWWVSLVWHSMVDVV